MTPQTAGPWKFVEIPGNSLTPLYSLFQTPLPAFATQFLAGFSFTGVSQGLVLCCTKQLLGCNSMKWIAVHVSSADTVCLLPGCQACPPLSSTPLALCVLREAWCTWDCLSEGTDQQNWHLLTSRRKELQHSFSLLVKWDVLWVLIFWQVQHCWFSFLKKL